MSSIPSLNRGFDASPLRPIRPTRKREVIPLAEGETLPDLEDEVVRWVDTGKRRIDLGSRKRVSLRGPKRCSVSRGLNGRPENFGDQPCPHRRVSDSLYCYYHDKVARGLLEPTGDLLPVHELPDFPFKLGKVVD